VVTDEQGDFRFEAVPGYAFWVTTTGKRPDSFKHVVADVTNGGVLDLSMVLDSNQAGQRVTRR
jgi:hypothetical protein